MAPLPLPSPTASAAKYIGAGVIWSFWGGNPPDLVLRCIQSIKQNNPGRPVIVVDQDTIQNFLEPSDFPIYGNGQRGEPSSFSCVQYLSDWVRLTLLEKYGGVWLDASCIATNSVDEWVRNQHQVTLFPMHANPNIHGNWAIGSPTPGHPVIRAWRDEIAAVYRDIKPGDIPTEYCKQTLSSFPEINELWSFPSPPPLPYLWPYLAFQVALHRYPDLRRQIDLIPSNNGPMYRRYLFNPNGAPDDSVSEKTAHHLATKLPCRERHDRYFIKLVGKDRAPVQQYLNSETYSVGSVIHDLSRTAPRPISYGVDLHNHVLQMEGDIDRLCLWAATTLKKRNTKKKPGRDKSKKAGAGYVPIPCPLSIACSERAVSAGAA